MEEKVDKKGVIKALVFAVLLAFLGIGILGWQYRQLEEEKIPALEERIEQKTVEAALEKFMQARMGGSEASALRYLTERAVSQKEENSLDLFNGLESYDIVQSEKTEDGGYRFVTRVYEKDRIGNVIEVLTIIKILDQYYIDSIEIAG